VTSPVDTANALRIFDAEAVGVECAAFIIALRIGGPL
jgi:hypothetical protein